jgi:carbon monoxide dehydrogenase subunit G
MSRYVTKVRTGRPVDEVFEYMADLRHFADWDPGVRQVVQVEGDGGGPGAVFDVTLSGRFDTTLRYRTVEHDPRGSLLVEARTAMLVSTDRISVEPDGDATVVTYDADLRLRGLAVVASPALALAFRHIGDRAAAGLRRVLDGVEMPA